MKRCTMTIRILVTLLAVLAFCVSAYAVKENPQLTTKKVGVNSNAPNPNWDLKAQTQGDVTHDQDINKDDPDNPNSINTVEDPQGGMAVGDDCSNPWPLTIDPSALPLIVTGQNNCGSINDYATTCLGSYDSGDDRIYKITVLGSGTVALKVTLDPHGTTYSGWAIDVTCPLNGSTCSYKKTNSAGTAYTLDNVILTAGTTYYMQVDTWATPTCVPNYDLTFAAMPAPPPNDDCVNAIAVGTVTSLPLTDMSAATFDGPGTFVTNRNIWYCYTADCNGMATASLCGSSFDTRIQIWDNCTCPPTLVLASDDDGCDAPGSSLASIASWDAVLGHQYLIEIGPYSATTTVGTAFLTTSCIIPPAGATCSNAIPVTLNPGLLPMTLAAQTNCGLFNNYSTTCLGSYDGGEDIVYVLTLDQPTYMDVTFDPKTSTYTGFLIDDACPPDPTTCLYKKTNSSAAAYTLSGVNLPAGTYYLMVDTYPSPTCIPNYDITFVVAAGPPANDTCYKATAIGDVSDLAFSTDNATADGSSTYITGPNIWYCYTATCDGKVTVSLCNSAYDTKVQVWDGCTCPPSALIVQDDDACGSPNGLASLVSFQGVLGHQYLIEVGGYSANTGSGHLTVTCTPPPPNDNCASVTPLPLVSGSPLTFTGNNSGATSDCAILGDPEVWHAFTTTECMDVTVDYCGTVPAFGNIYIVLTSGCPCGSYVLGSYEFTSCGDGNGSIHYYGLPAGTWYVPVLEDPAYSASGPYTVHVTGNSVVAYCPAGSNLCDEYISNVTVGTINNSSSCGAGGYENWTALSTDMTQGLSYSITVANGLPYSSDQCGIWIDWNNDFCFSPDEQMTVSGTPGGGPYTATITAPCTVPVGSKLLRTRITYTGSVSPCGSPSYGEVEDYTINLLAHPIAPPTAVLVPNPQYAYYEYALSPITNEFYVGNFAGSYLPQDVNLSSITVNGLAATGASVIASYTGIYCGAVKVLLPLNSFLPPYGPLFDTTYSTFTVAGTFNDATPFSIDGDVTLIGHRSIVPGQYIAPPNVVVLPGDFNLDGLANVTDVTAVISYIFAGGTAPNVLAADVDCTGVVNVSDVVYYIAWIFSGGPNPTQCGGN